MKSKVYFKILSLIVLICMVVSIACINVNAASSGITNNSSFTRVITPETVKVNEKQNITIKYSGDLKLPYKIVPEKEIVMLIDTSGSLFKSPDQVVYFPDYCLFSGNQLENTNLEFRGNEINIEGKVHSNSGIIIAANKPNFSYTDEDNNKITEKICEYVTNKKVEQTNSQLKQEAEAYLVKSETAALPDINSKINEYVANRLKGKVFIFDGSNTTKFQESVDKYKKELKDRGYPDNIDITLNGKGDNGATNFKVGGGTTFNILPNVKLDFRGNVQFINSVKFNEYGIVVAENNIIIQGTGVSTGIDPVTKKENEAFFYSLHGNIYNDIAGTAFTGTYYAPEGFIRLHGDKVDIKGSVLSKDIILEPSNSTVKYDKDSEGNKMFKTILPKPTLYDKVYDAAKSYLGKLADDIEAKNFKAPVRIGILTYDSTANSNNYNNIRFYNGLVNINKRVNGTFVRDEVGDLQAEIDLIQSDANLIFKKNNPVDERVGKSNLGDGLRGAKTIFSSTNDNILKTLIVFTGSNPNTWSAYTSDKQKYYGNDDIGTYSKTEYVYEDNIKATSDILASDSYKYASEMGKKLAAAGIVPKFINCLPNDEQNKDAYKLTDFAFKRLETDILSFGNKPSSFSKDINKLYYDTQGDLNKMTDAIDEITDEIYTNNVSLKGTLNIKFTLPEETKYTLAGGIQRDPKDPNGRTYSFVKNDYNLAYDKATGKYLLEPIELNLQVKNVLKKKVTLVNGKATVDVKYPANADNKAVLTFDYYGDDGTLIPGSIETLLPEDKITLVYEVDIT